MPTRQSTLLLLFCACLSAQPAARETRDLAVTRASDAGTVTIHLRNQYSAPATAWILLCETPQGGSRHYWEDQDLSFLTKPLVSGEEIEFKITLPMALPAQRLAELGTCEDFHLEAAIFADGTVSGDLRWINAMVAERREAWQELAKVTDLLNAAISKGTATPDVIQQLTDLRGGMRGRPSPIYGFSSGGTSRGTEPPPQRPLRAPVPSAALWLIQTEGKTLPDTVKALADWRERLAQLPAVAETGEPSPPANRVLRTGPFTPPSDPELIGKPAPAFTLKDVEGREISLASLRGKPVLLDFWATWCEPCREEMPHIQALYDQFKDQGLTVVCIDINEPAERPKKYFADRAYIFANLLDSGSGTSQKYGAGGIPRVILIDKDGIVRYFHRGWGTGTDLAPEVKKLVQ